MRFVQFITQFIVGTGSLWRSAAPIDAAAELTQHEYSRRLAERERRLARISSLYRRLWVAFIACVAAAVVVGFLRLMSLLPLVWVLPPLAAAAFAFRSLTRLANDHAHLSKVIRFYETGVARLCGQWQGMGVGGEQYHQRNIPMPPISICLVLDHFSNCYVQRALLSAVRHWRIGCSTPRD